MIKSEITGQWYDPDEMVFYKNPLQSAYMLEWGEKLVDIFTDSDHRLIFVFTRDSHRRCIDKWMKQKRDAAET